ncbi:transketolase [bacterium]|nr:MAG: transketolase [bacterium]
MIDILAVLYADVLNVLPSDPEWPYRDRLIVSKGHGAVGLYAVLGEMGFFPTEEFETYGQDGARLMGHVSHKVPGIELSTGSLGHGLPVACGLALGLPKAHTYCILGDGELNEGSNWEAIMFAAHHRLGNLTAIVDHNKIQSLGRTEEVLDMGSIAKKFAAFGWRVLEIDGHDHDALRQAFEEISSPLGEGRVGVTKPTCIVAHTVKGKGVDFMEDDLAWHYKSPNDAQLESALDQVANTNPLPLGRRVRREEERNEESSEVDWRSSSGGWGGVMPSVVSHP